MLGGVNDSNGPATSCLFLCTQNSARSQIAEAILRHRRDPRVTAASAGTEPAHRVHPAAIAELKRIGIDWGFAKPKDVSTLMSEEWDIVITVCDKARELCPTFPGRPVVIHWGIADPALVQGDERTIAKAFEETSIVLGRRIGLMLSLPMDRLTSLAVEQRESPAVARESVQP